MSAHRLIRWILILGLSHVLTLGSAVAGPFPENDRVSVSGEDDPNLRPFDDLMTDFVRRNKIPGAALAVTKNGRLVYARGFGYADLSTREPVRPESLFRIASVSKPITAVAVLQLVEQKRLTLSDRVVDVLKLEEKAPEPSRIDPRWRKVTIHDLLRHTGGWDRDQAFDPMFRSVPFARAAGAEPPADQNQVIRAMLGKPLQFDPGERFAYSNFGYCLLGRVVETVSGESYEDYVQAHVLNPLGIQDMRIGRTLREGRLPGEVAYYVKEDQTAPSVFGADVGKPVPPPYGAWYLEAMDCARRLDRLGGGSRSLRLGVRRGGTGADNPEPRVDPGDVRPPARPARGSSRTTSPRPPITRTAGMSALKARMAGRIPGTPGHYRGPRPCWSAGSMVWTGPSCSIRGSQPPTVTPRPPPSTRWYTAPPTR